MAVPYDDPVKKAYDNWQAAKPSWFSQQTPTGRMREQQAEADYGKALQDSYGRVKFGGNPGAGTPGSQPPSTPQYATLASVEGTKPPAAPALPAAPAAPAALPATSGNVTRVGNSYSGTNIGGDITINGQTPGGGFMVADSGRPRNLAEAAGVYPGSSPARPMGDGIAARLRAEQDANPGGQVSPQNMAAGDSLAARAMAESQARMQPQDRPRNLAEAAGIIPGQGSSSYDPNAGGSYDWMKDLRDQRTLAMRNASVGSTIFRNQAEAMMAGKAKQANIAGARGAVAGQMHDAQQADTARYQSDNSLAGNLGTEQMRQQGANQRSLWQYALDQQRVNQAGEAAGYTNRANKLVEAARNQVAAEQDPTKRRGLVQYMRDIEGRTEQADPYLVVPGGQHVDPQSGKAYNTPASVFNRQSGQFVQQPGQGGALPQGMTKMVGTSGGKPVYEDANGKRYVAG